MSTIQKIRQYFYKNSLDKQLSSKRGTVFKTITFENAKTIAFLFDANDLNLRKVILKYAADLKKQGKKITLLGFMENTHENQNYTYSYYNLKNIDWANRPKGEVIDEFVKQEFDILMTTYLQTNLHTEYISALSNACFKVGPVAKNPKVYDLMIDAGEKMNLLEFLRQIEIILKKTKKKPELQLA